MKKLDRFFLKNTSELLTIITLLVACITGLYINLLTNKIDNKTFRATIIELSWWNLLILIVVVLVLLQNYIQNIPKKYLTQKKDSLISLILEAACNTLIYPETTLHIRAIVTLCCDDKTGQRETKYTFNAESDPERVAAYPNEFGITGEAFTKKSVVIKQLKVTHHKTYGDETKKHILPQVRTILAAPLLKSNNIKDEPLGVLAFDSINTIEELKWNKIQVRKIAQEWADILSKLLIVTEV